MRLIVKKKTASKTVARLKKRVRIRKRIEGTSERPRLCVFRSNKNIYAQIIDDESRKVLAQANSLKLGGCNIKTASEVGNNLAKKSLKNKIKNVVFDRSGYLYHGKIKALADAARKGGLNF